MLSRRQFLALGAVTVVAAACSSDDDSASTTASSDAASTTDASGTEASTVPATDAPTTTAAPTTEPPTTPAPTDVVTTTTLAGDEAAMAYTEAGPYPVGVTTIQLTAGPAVEIWYPAAEGTTGEVSYDVRDFVPESVRAVLTADVPATYTFAGARDAQVADAPDASFPIVLFSHGFSGMRLQSTFLTAHLASWGFVVAAPDHASSDLANVLGGTASGDREESVGDLLRTLDQVQILHLTDTLGWGDKIDDTRVVAVGHSAGGGTVVGAAMDDRIAAYVSLASGLALGRGEEGATTTTIDPAAVPQRPSLFMAGSLDAVVPAETVTIPSFEAAATPSWLWVIDGVGHNGFDDFCTFGNGTGIIGIAEASGLGPFLDAQPQLRTLGEDGCVAPAVPVEQTFPIVRHAVTAFIRHIVGIDGEPVGLGPDVAELYEVPVSISVRD